MFGNVIEPKDLVNNITNIEIPIDTEPKFVSFEDYFDPRFPRWISIALFFIGLIGNTICLIIFSQKNMRKYSTFVYLAFLSIVDLFVLTLGLGDIILISYLHYVIRNQSLIICRLLSFLIYASTHLSSFILASVSIDRAIATNFINFSKIYCKPKVAYRIIFINIFLATLINFHSFIFLGYEEQVLVENFTSVDYLEFNLTHESKSSCICGSQNGTIYDKFLDPYFKLIDLLSYAIIPFFIMAISSYMIIRVILLSNKRLNRNKKQHQSLLNKKQTQSKSTNKAKHLTYTLITLNCLFFCLVSPLVLVLILLNGKETDGSNKIVINIVYLLAYSNHSFNFVLYGFSSPPFRESLFRLLRINQIPKSTNVANLNNKL
ncbi:unnamed protein product [Brachionus calyciflorus]|uniref:G-protein coupled receptors family 1 profile domain-containing protein n=1 Tax=Brachionus calyciflorus TaxID=104777 RepID=A0A814FKA9_9BILA|nr:unnamed protein product [Brachionus calyciflorus]